MCFVPEMILFAWGVYAFRNGLFKFFGLIHVEGGIAQVLGAILMVPLVTCIVGDTALGIAWQVAGLEWVWLLAFAGFQLGLDVLVTLIAFLGGFLFTTRSKVRRRRRSEYDDYR